jgi:peptide/nickel transport system permease protein
MAQSESQDIVTAPPISEVAVPTSRRHGAFRRVLHKPLGLISLAVLVLLTLIAILGPLYGQDPNFSELSDVNAAPGTPGHPLGADQFGRDTLARLLASLKVSLISGAIGAGVSTILGTVFGLIAGYTGRRTDTVTSWVFSLVMTFPALVLVLVLYPLTGGSYQVMMVIFGVFLSPGTFRLVRNLVIVVRNELYVDAARVAGLSDFRILSRHVLYVIRGPLIISVAFLASAAIGIQAGLAFLGLGSTLVPSFGSMTSDAFANIYREPAQLVWPTLGLALLTGSIVLLGNALRDVLMDVGVVAKSAKKATRRDKSGTPAATIPVEAEMPHGGLLALRNLEVSYPQPDGSQRMVVSGVSLDVKIGEVVGLVGESGSGKTQTAFAILGLLPPEARVRADLLSVGGDPISLSDPAAMRGIRG